jgi:hypothetical protein
MGDAGLYTLFYIWANISPSANLFSMKMEAECTSEMMVSTYSTTHHVPTEHNLYTFISVKTSDSHNTNRTNTQELLTLQPMV